jgi:hypothetical protein
MGLLPIGESPDESGKHVNYKKKTIPTKIEKKQNL